MIHQQEEHIQCLPILPFINIPCRVRFYSLFWSGQSPVSITIQPRPRISLTSQPNNFVLFEMEIEKLLPNQWSHNKGSDYATTTGKRSSTTNEPMSRPATAEEDTAEQLSYNNLFLDLLNFSSSSNLILLLLLLRQPLSDTIISMEMNKSITINSDKGPLLLFSLSKSSFLSSQVVGL